MKDIEVRLVNRPGALSEMSRVLGDGGISIEGGGVWVVHDFAIGHYLFADEAPAAEVLAANGIEVVAEREVVLLRLKQAIPGQLGTATASMCAAGVNILAQYSDHEGQLVLVVDNLQSAREVANAWTDSTG